MTFLTVQEPPIDPERAKETESAFTPYPVAAQALGRAAEFFQVAPTHNYKTIKLALDPSAGAGVWCQAMREVFQDPYVFAAELREEERPHLVRNASEFMIGDFLTTQFAEDAFDLLATNPPFTLFKEFADVGLRVAEHVWLFCPVDICMRKQADADWFVENQGLVQAEFVTPGPISFLGDGNSDFRTYSLWCLGQHNTGPGWHRELLPLLPSSSRRWVHRPGTEVRL